jgi:hypothetical protein
LKHSENRKRYASVGYVDRNLRYIHTLLKILIGENSVLPSVATSGYLNSFWDQRVPSGVVVSEGMGQVGMDGYTTAFEREINSRVPFADLRGRRFII